MVDVTASMQFRNTEAPRGSQEITPNPTLRYPLPISPVQLQTTDTTIHSALSEADFQLESLIAVNVTGSNAHVTVHIVPAGGAAGIGNAVVYQKVVPQNDFVALFTSNQSMLVPPGSSIVASCQTNNAINLHGFGYDYLGVFGG